MQKRYRARATAYSMHRHSVSRQYSGTLDGYVLQRELGVDNVAYSTSMDFLGSFGITCKA